MTKKDIVRTISEEVGLTQVINLAGGIAAWSQEVDPTVATY